MHPPQPQSFAERFASPPATPRSQADQLIARSGHLIHKLKAKDTTGRWASYFVYVERAREQAFLAALKSGGIIDLEAHGRILASCYGEEPDEKTRAFLKEKYGFDV